MYAVEASWEMVAAARQIVADNGLAGVVTVIQGRVEDAEIPVSEDESLRVTSTPHCSCVANILVKGLILFANIPVDDKASLPARSL